MTEDRTQTTETERETVELDPATTRRAIRERYGDVAAESATCCDEAPERTDASKDAPDGADCCAANDGGAGDASKDDDHDALARELGYTPAEIEAVADGANLGLGCGNPTAIASLEPGQTVLDLGSGGGFDCFLAADEVGEMGAVIGVDMTPAMVETARENADANDASNVDFRLGEIEHLPVADASIDVAISNCVVNLSPDKPQVFRDTYRVLRPGGRLAISDVVLTASLPVDLANDPESVAGCVAGAAEIPALESMLEAAGFVDISIEPQADSESFIRDWDADRDLSEYVVAATIEARKPPA